MVFRDNLDRLTQTLETNANQDLEEIQIFIADACEDDIRSCPKQFITFCHTLTEALIKSNRSVCGINPMSIAITKLQAHQSQLTPIHSNLCLLCLDSKNLNPAINFLEINYTEIRKSDEKDDDVKQVQYFYYYGGLIYAAIKNFDRASFFFENVLTMPACVMNPIMQETYKKQIIIALLLNGRLPDNLLPKYTSHCVQRHKKQVNNSYLKLAHEYASLNYANINALVTSGSNIYERDENMGLIKQCLTQIHKRSIKRLTKTFLTLPLREVANHVGLASESEAEKYILNMIEDEEIFATIDQKHGMVVFRDDPEKYDSVAIFQKLQEDMHTCITLINTLKKIEVEAPAADPKLLSKLSGEFQ